VKNIIGKNQKGITLIELLIVMGIFGIVMGAIYSIYTAHQRTAYTQDEVVEVQQNLLIGIDSITRDVRMAGILVPYIPITQVQMPPVQLASDATGTMQPLPAPDNVKSDDMTLNAASASATFARITPLNNATTYIVTAATFSIPVDSPTTVDFFTVNDDYVRIMRPQDKSEPQLSTDPLLTPRVYRVTGKNRNVPELGLTIEGGYLDPTNINLNKGDMICKTDAPHTTFPNTIRYCLGPATGCGLTVTTCPTGQLCLMRIVNSSALNTAVIAQNMAGLQFRYLMDDNTEVDAPAPATYKNIRAVRVTLTGQTIITKALSDNQNKKRQIESVIQIRNR
jgi:prepilin-type N-terminal cleavage/methylation domain-containing protein